MASAAAVERGEQPTEDLVACTCSKAGSTAQHVFGRRVGVRGERVGTDRRRRHRRDRAGPAFGPRAPAAARCTSGGSRSSSARRCREFAARACSSADWNSPSALSGSMASSAAIDVERLAGGRAHRPPLVPGTGVRGSRRRHRARREADGLAEVRLGRLPVAVLRSNHAGEVVQRRDPQDAPRRAASTLAFAAATSPRSSAAWISETDTGVPCPRAAAAPARGHRTPRASRTPRRACGRHGVGPRARLAQLLEGRQRRVGLGRAALAAVDARQREVRLGVRRVRGGGAHQQLHRIVRAVALLEQRAEMIERGRETASTSSASLNSASASCISPRRFSRMPRFTKGQGHFSPLTRVRRIASRYWRTASSGWFSAS